MAFLEYAGAINAERYRVTSIKVKNDGSRKVLFLTKRMARPWVSRRKNCYIGCRRFKNCGKGGNIYYTPLSENLHHILIDDMTGEKLAQLQKDGFRPAAIIESSPGNFQCILTFAKFGNAFDWQIANRLIVLLNRKYGDPKLSGAIHPHRAQALKIARKSIGAKMAQSRNLSCDMP